MYIVLKEWDGWAAFLQAHGVPTASFPVPEGAVEAIVHLFLLKAKTLLFHTHGTLCFVFEGTAGTVKSGEHTKRHR
jgi:hypothetical protein